MKLKNTNKRWTDTFLRRMTSWCCKQLGLPVRFVKEITFRNKQYGYSGRCWHWKTGCRIVCSICKEYSVSQLVELTAHELRHALAELHNERTRGSGWRVASSEKVTEHDARKVLSTFLERQDELVAEWNKPIAARRKAAPLTAKEKRAIGAEKKLAEWQKKAKLAATKIKKYKKMVRYYERNGTLAATRTKNTG